MNLIIVIHLGFFLLLTLTSYSADSETDTIYLIHAVSILIYPACTRYIVIQFSNFTNKYTAEFTILD